MYAVIKTTDGSYVRLAEEYGSMASGLLSFLPAAALSALLSLVIAVFLANRFSNSVTGPIIAMNDSLIGVKDGSVTLKPGEYPYGELRDMAEQINALAADVGTHMERLRDERNKLSFILDNMSEGFILMDDRQNLQLINNSACAYMRCDKSAIGHDVSHCTQNYNFLQTADDVTRNRMNKSIDVIMDGKVIETDFMVVSGQNDLSDNIIITMTDVTAKRDAVKLRRDFFTNASHELKTPITSIKGSVELLCADISLEDAQREELLVRIGIETERMYSLINDIIMINRLESGELTGEKENVDLSAVIRECCEEIKPLADQVGVTVSIDLESAELYADHKNAYEMVSNLVMNAVKYNKQNGRVDICLKVAQAGITLTVRNDGEIIPPEHHHRVFERFYRVDKSRSKTVGGTGLGLSIVKHVVDNLGGMIRLESNEKNGTTLTITIPILNA